MGKEVDYRDEKKEFQADAMATKMRKEIYIYVLSANFRMAPAGNASAAP